MTKKAKSGNIRAMSNTTDIKQLNISTILSTLHREKELTKTEIAKRINLSSVTAHNLINELKTKGVVIETGDFLHGGGRKATKYKLNKDYALSIGMHFYRYALEISVCDLSLDLVYEKKVEWDMHDLDLCLKTLKEELLCVTSAFNDKKFLGVGVSIPGRADKDGVIIELPDRKNWNGINLKQEIESATGLIARIDNDVNAEAISVKWSGVFDECENFAYLCADDGTGASVVINGQIFHGFNHFGPEIGHITAVKGGRICECGKKGCLQAYTSTLAVIEWFKSLGFSDANVKLISQLYSAQDKDAVKVIGKVCEYLALGIEYLIRAFDPEKIIVQSSILENDPVIFEEVIFNVCKGLYPRKNFAKIVISKKNEKISKCASCCLVLNDFYSAC